VNANPGVDLLLRPVYRMFAAVFFLVGLLFFVFPDGTIDALNAVGAALGFPDAPHLAHRFWLGLAVSYMAVVTALAYLISQAPTERRLLMLPLAIGKMTSSLTCLLFLVFDHLYFIYFANFLVDGSIALGALWTRRLTAPPAASPEELARGVAATLDEGSRRILRAIAEAFLPRGGAFPLGAEEIALAEKVETHLAGFHPLVLPLTAVILRWVDVQPLFHLRAARLQSLTVTERVRVLEAMEHSRLLVRRQPVLLLKLFLGLHAYRDPSVARQVGYDRAHLDERVREAAERRGRGGKGPYPIPRTPVPPGGA
jgi:hypothetical protein